MIDENDKPDTDGDGIYDSADNLEPGQKVLKNPLITSNVNYESWLVMRVNIPKVISYRIDRMIHVELCTKEYVPLPDGCELTAFTKEVFKMYDGVDQEVDLICDNALMKNLVDHFGDDFIVRPESKETFRATVKVSVSRTFYAWVFQFAGGIRIAGPEGVREEYLEMLKNAMK